jgi:hypothetical protein
VYSTKPGDISPDKAEMRADLGNGELNLLKSWLLYREGPQGGGGVGNVGGGRERGENKILGALVIRGQCLHYCKHGEVST